MENASKALIIAGAILISIILISIGILVVNSANGLLGQSQTQIDSQEIEMFNSKFTSDVGQKKGSTVRNLMGRVNSSNASNDEERQISVEGPNGETTPDDIINSIKSTTTYTVKMETGKNGLINKITITLGGGSTTSSNP